MNVVTVKPSGEGGDFTTLKAAVEDAGTSPGDLFYISGTFDSPETNGMTISDGHVKIFKDPASNHSIACDDGNHAITVDDVAGVILDGLTVRQNQSGASDEGIRFTGGASSRLWGCVRNCTIHGPDTPASDQDGIYIANLPDFVLHVVQCKIFNWGRAGVHYQNSASTRTGSRLYINSCSIYNCGGNVSTNSGGGVLSWLAGSPFSELEINCHNSLALGNTSGSSSDFGNYLSPENGTTTWNISNCIASDTSPSDRDSGGSGNLESRTATDTTSPGAGDWVVFNDITAEPYNLDLVSDPENDAQKRHNEGASEGMKIPRRDPSGTVRPQGGIYDCGAHEISEGEVVASNESLFEFQPIDSVAPDTNPATLGTFDAATGVREFLKFTGSSGGVDQVAIFPGVWPSQYGGGGINVQINYTTDGTDKDAIQFEVSVEVVQDGDDQDAGGQDFGTATDITDTPIATAENIMNFSAVGVVSHANCGSPVAGDQFRLKLSRDHDHATNPDSALVQSIVITEQ